MTIIVLILILGVLVFVHELGHFIAAKFFKVYCGAFSIGMGPKIFGKKGKETDYVKNSYNYFLRHIYLFRYREYYFRRNDRR